MLSASRINVQFGGVIAVSDVSVDVGRGELLGVIGPNGSGKTTLLNALCGVVPATGYLRLGAAELRLGDPAGAYRAGIVRLFQAPQMFSGLTVLENVLVAVREARGRGVTSSVFRRRWMIRYERTRWSTGVEALERVGLTSLADSPVERLTYGQQRLLELARAIAAQPTVLLLDEPTAGLNDVESAHLVELLSALQSEISTAVLLVDHKIDVVNALATRVMVLDRGVKLLDAAPKNVWNDARVQHAYLGTGSHV